MPPHFLVAIRIPASLLVAIDDRTLQFWMQPVHFVIRIVHILSMAAFFGGILLVDLRLMGWRGALSLRDLTRQTMPAVYWAFAVTVVTGLALFFYDPVHVGSHAYFVPKMLFLVLGGINAWTFHETGYVRALAAGGVVPRSAAIAGAMSILFWTGVVVFACLDTEAAPRVLLR